MNPNVLMTCKFSENLTNEQARMVLQIASDVFALKYRGWSFPIEFFNLNEKLIRRVSASCYGGQPRALRVFYRGPRKSNNCNAWSKPSHTRRQDAVAVVVQLGRRVVK